MSNLDINEIIKNQKFQNATDELIEEKNRQDEVIKEASNYLYNQNMDQIAQIIESQNTYTEEEQQYMNSPYYANYQNIINNLDTLIMQPIYDLNYKYIYNHIKAGAKKVIISAPAKGDLKTVVYGVNENVLDGTEEVISAASCTTNCLAPTLRIMDYYFKIKKGYMTTVHAYTNDQATLDVAHKKGFKSRRGRAAAANIVPTSTGAASAIGKVLPNLEGKLDGTAMRVPVTTGSVIDLTLELEKNTTVEEINKAFEINQNDTIKITTDPIVSSDIIGSHVGALVDTMLTNVLEVDGKQLVKVVAWYDNEMGYSSQMVRLAKYVGQKMNK